MFDQKGLASKCIQDNVQSTTFLDVPDGIMGHNGAHTRVKYMRVVGIMILESVIDLKNGY